MSWNLFTIDPSTRKLGWACFKINEPKRIATYVASAGIKLKDGQDTDPQAENEDDAEYIQRSDEMAHRLTKEVHWYAPPLILIELPRVFASNEAAMRSNAITKLALCVGVIRGTFRALGFAVQCVPVSVWKGQTPKDVTLHRIERAWNLSPRDDNEADAIGIGDWYIRKSLKYATIPVREKGG